MPGKYFLHAAAGATVAAFVAIAVGAGVVCPATAGFGGAQVSAVPWVHAERAQRASDSVRHRRQERVVRQWRRGERRRRPYRRRAPRDRVDWSKAIIANPAGLPCSVWNSLPDIASTNLQPAILPSPADPIAAVRQQNSLRIFPRYYLETHRIEFALSRRRNKGMGQIEEESATEKNQKHCECQIESGARSRRWLRVIDLLGDLQKADPRNSDHAAPRDDERKTYKVGELLAWDRKLATSQGGRCDLKKEVELFDQETEGHDGDGSAHPREECALIGGMIAEIPDHRCSPVLSLASVAIEGHHFLVRKPPVGATTSQPSPSRNPTSSGLL
jgi:hypothetical protein